MLRALPESPGSWSGCDLAALASLRAASAADAAFFRAPLAARRAARLLDQLGDEAWERRCAAVEAAAHQGAAFLDEAALGTLAPALAGAASEDGNRYVCYKAVRALGRLAILSAGPARTLAALLEHDDEDLRSWVAEALSGLDGGPHAAAACGELARLALHHDPGTRAAALEALAKLGASSEGAVPALARSLADADQGSRLAAAQGLSDLGAAASSAAPELRAALGDEDGDVRLKALEALERAGALGSVRLAEWSRFFCHDSKYVCYRVIQALGALGRPAAAGLLGLAQLLRDQDADVRLWAVEALAAFGEAASVAAPQLNLLLDDEDPDVRTAAEQLLDRVW
ncbi:unnamed protein product [Prorocentrum cordatum]|uniref:Uncharacterized protein n=1 Tax=Prorocentrum cordatum TaxID=2364126 RepID=A0ABN9WNW3_9DINO|nr:unnamed protein product [Polarella glacialis]